MTVSVTDVRQFLRDQPEFNILLAAKEFTDDDITKAMEFAVSEYNAMTPITTTELSAFPTDWLLLLGTTAHLLRSAAHRLRSKQMLSSAPHSKQARVGSELAAQSTASEEKHPVLGSSSENTTHFGTWLTTACSAEPSVQHYLNPETACPDLAKDSSQAPLAALAGTTVES